MFPAVVLIAFLLHFAVGQDPVEYIRRNGRPLHPFNAYFNVFANRVNWICLGVTDYDYTTAIDYNLRSLFTDVPIGLVPMSESIETLCPCLKRVGIGIDALHGKLYNCEIQPRNDSGYYNDSFYMATEEGYCGANFPIYSKVVREGTADESIYYAPREELIRDDSELIGYVWKYPHLNPDELEEVQAEVTSLNRIFYRVITTRSSNYTYTYTLHHPTLQVYLGLGYYYNSVIGLVIGQNQLSHNLKEKCPLLLQVDVKKKDGLVSWMGYDLNYAISDQPESYTDPQSFWCAPYMGYCGAYVNLQRLPSAKRDEDMLITSEYWEARRKATEYKFKVEAPPPQTICWIWYPHRETVKTLFEQQEQDVKEGKLRLFRGRWTTGDNKNIHAYTTRPGRLSNWLNAGFNNGSELGYLVAADKVPVTGCPNLIMMKIYQETGGRQRTFIGGNYSPNIKTKGKWVLETTFYCAPYAGYCGATKLLWAFNALSNPYADIMYGTDSATALQWEQDNKYSTYQLCYIWSIW